jgi:hypothetical protein
MEDDDSSDCPFVLLKWREDTSGVDSGHISLIAATAAAAADVVIWM